MPVKIKAKKDLFNGGKCFSKDKEYDLPEHVTIIIEKSQLMNLSVINDQGQQHRISTWYKYFEIVKSKKI